MQVVYRIKWLGNTCSAIDEEGPKSGYVGLAYPKLTFSRKQNSW